MKDTQTESVTSQETHDIDLPYVKTETLDPFLYVGIEVTALFPHDMEPDDLIKKGFFWVEFRSLVPNATFKPVPMNYTGCADASSVCVKDPIWNSVNSL